MKSSITTILFIFGSVMAIPSQPTARFETSQAHFLQFDKTKTLKKRYSSSDEIGSDALSKDNLSDSLLSKSNLVDLLVNKDDPWDSLHGKDNPSDNTLSDLLNPLDEVDLLHLFGDDGLLNGVLGKDNLFGSLLGEGGLFDILRKNGLLDSQLSTGNLVDILQLASNHSQGLIGSVLAGLRTVAQSLGLSLEDLASQLTGSGRKGQIQIDAEAFKRRVEDLQKAIEGAKKAQPVSKQQ